MKGQSIHEKHKLIIIIIPNCIYESVFQRLSWVELNHEASLVSLEFFHSLYQLDLTATVGCAPMETELKTFDMTDVHDDQWATDALS